MSEVLTVDTREPPKIKEMFQRMSSEYEIPVELGALTTGDMKYRDLIFERKTISDFVSSIRGGHLQKQLLMMQERYKIGFLIISGNLKTLVANQYVRGWTVNHQMGAIASVSVRYPKIKLIQVENDRQLANVIFRICKKAYDGRVISFADTELVPLLDSVSAVKQKVLAGIPMIDFKTAEKILDRFDLKELFSASIPDLKLIDGIGQKKAEMIKTVFS